MSHPRQPWRPESPRHARWLMRRATSISAAIEKAFTGLKFTGDWSRWLIHKADGVKIERPTYIDERGSLELVIRVEPDANYDRVYRLAMQVLESQPGYESRGTPPSAFTADQEDAIEQMPKESEGRSIRPLSVSPRRTVSQSAADVLRTLMYRRRELWADPLDSDV